MPEQQGERPSWLPERAPPREDPVEGAMAVPGHVAAVEAAIEAEVRRAPSNPAGLLLNRE